MTNDDVYKKVTDKIIEKLEQGIIPWKKPWKAGAFQPMNMITKQPYHGVNLWLLGHGDTPYWLTFKQVQKLKGHVRKGEKASINVLWKPVKEKDDEGKEHIKFWLFRYYNVFNYSQCEGLPPVPEFAQPEDFVSIEKAEEVIQLMPNKPTIVHNEQRAYYNPSNDFVNLPKKETFTSADHYYATAFHELVHSTGNAKRLNRFAEDGSNMRFGSNTYAKEELVAELGSCFICNRLHLDQNLLENTTAYIQSWIKRLKDDYKMIVSASSKAEKAVKYIFNEQNA